MSVTEDPSRPTSTNPLFPFTLNRGAIVKTIRAFAEGNPNLVTEVLLKCYRLTPGAAVSVFAAFVGGPKEDHELIINILNRLYDMDPVIGNTVFLSLLTREPYESVTSPPGHATASM